MSNYRKTEDCVGCIVDSVALLGVLGIIGIICVGIWDCTYGVKHTEFSGHVVDKKETETVTGGYSNDTARSIFVRVNGEVYEASCSNLTTYYNAKVGDEIKIDVARCTIGSDTHISVK